MRRHPGGALHHRDRELKIPFAGKAGELRGKSYRRERSKGRKRAASARGS